MITIQPVSFFIPPEIQAGLVNGDLIRYGGVVRDGAGRVVRHLKEAPLTEGGEAAAERLLSGLRNPWVIAGVGIGVIVIGGIAALALRRRVQAQELVTSYNASFAAYLEAVRDGALDEAIISQLIADLDAIKASSDAGKITVGFSTEQSETLVTLVADYTRKLAELNAVALDSVQAEMPGSEAGSIADLRRHLDVQRQIFARAA